MREMYQVPLTHDGVYFLILGSKLVYIGQSINVIYRIGEHIKSCKVFDKAFYYPTPHLKDKERYNLETALIHRFQPEYNISSKECYVSEMPYDIRIAISEKSIPHDLLATIHLMNKCGWNIEKATHQCTKMQIKQKNAFFEKYGIDIGTVLANIKANTKISVDVTTEQQKI